MHVFPHLPMFVSIFFYCIFPNHNKMLYQSFFIGCNFQKISEYSHIISSRSAPTCHIPNYPIGMALNLHNHLGKYWHRYNIWSFSLGKVYASLPFRFFSVCSATIYSFLPGGLACLLVSLFLDILWFWLLTCISFSLLHSLINHAGFIRVHCCTPQILTLANVSQKGNEWKQMGVFI